MKPAFSGTLKYVARDGVAQIDYILLHHIVNKYRHFKSDGFDY